MAFAMPQPQLQQQFQMPQPNALPTYYNNAHPQAQHPQVYANYPQPTHSPISAPPTPTAVSPTSQILLHKKGPVAKTLYTPAVLRPTENPRPRKLFSLPISRNSPAPLTPPGSLQSSLDSLDNHSQKQSLLSRRNTGDSLKAGLSVEGVTLYEEEILLRDPEEPGYGKVTGFPTRVHWKADCTATICTDPTCNRAFSYFNRKHHCRRCGSIFCDTHSSNLIPLNQDAEFHPLGNRVRGCDSCWRDYTGWEIKRVEIHEQRARLRRGTLHEPPSTISSPVSVLGIDGEGWNRRREGGGISPPQMQAFQGEQPAQVAASVPGNWSWSTF